METSTSPGKSNTPRTLDLDSLTLLSGSHAAASKEMCAQPLGRRLASFLRPDGECLVFTGTRTEDGYGNLSVDGRTLKAHRVAYELVHGPIPEDRVLLHSCDNPPCCYVDHLSVGTVGQNNTDRHQKGRSRGLFVSGPSHPATQRRGERHWHAKLSAADVAAIRDRRANGAPVKVLAAEFGVHHATISRVARGIWRSEVAS